jgi:hypothetical protein
MDELLKGVERLGRTARGEPAPSVNVTARVAAALAEGPVEDEGPLGWLAMAAVAAAAILALSLIPVAREWSDPLVALVTGLSWGLL